MTKPWALITGATAGIGEATAKILAANQFNLIITGRRKGKLNDLAGFLENQHSIETLPLSFDISNSCATFEKIQQNIETVKKVSVLINNAGLARGVAPIDQANIEDWNEMIDTNIKGLFQMTRIMLPVLKEHAHADIINLGSVAGRWTYPGGAVYCATKHAVLAFTEGLRKDLCGSNIRACCIEPGLVHTEFSKVRLQDEDKADQVYQGLTPLKAEDIAETVLWTLQRPRHVNIQEMVIYPTAQASVTQVSRR